MADTLTSKYGFTKPEVGASSDTWGTKLNSGLDKIDALTAATATTGSANAYVLSSGLSLSAYASGQTFLIIPNFTNTGAATINVDTRGAKNIFRAGAALTGGEIVSGRVYTVTYDGTQFQLLAIGVGRVVSQVFTSSGTYTPTSGMLYAIIECVGGGGGGGGCANSTAGNQGAAGAGGGGGYARKLVAASDIGASKTVTIGAAGTAGTAGANNGGNGGDTSVGVLCVGKGGSGGGGAASNNGAAGGAGGVAGTGDVTIAGELGENGYSSSAITSSVLTAKGGKSAFGGGSVVAGVYSANNSYGGGAGYGYGGGGGGGKSGNGAGASAGGAGSAGIVIITEFCI